MLALRRVLAALSLCLLFGGNAQAAERHRHAARHIESPDDLYSRRALRRARIIIEMQLLELRKQRLECVRGAILRRLPRALRPREGTRLPDPETCNNLFL